MFAELLQPMPHEYKYSDKFYFIWYLMKEGNSMLSL